MRRGNLLKLLLLVVIVAIATIISINPLKDPNKGIPLGLDIRGGVHLALQAYPGTGGGEITKDDMDRAKVIVEKRVNAIGVSEPNIVVNYDKKRIYVDLAGVKNPDDAVKIMSTTAQLTFRDPDDNTKVVLSGSDLKDAKPGQDSRNGQYVVDLTFNSDGAKKFADLTTKNVNKIMPIYLDDKEVQAPNIREPITNGQAQISGSFKSLQEAADTANMLRSGALPVPLKIDEKRQVGATLGTDSLLKSLNAAKYGIALVFIFMLIWYRVPGVIADFSLVVYVLIVLWVLWLFHAVLTLPGLAGLILSIGMAVDFNIIIYERLKEEIKAGKSLRAAIDAAFNRAFHTVIDAHVTTSIAGITLYLYGTGPIQGFALTLLIGIVASLFTALTFTRYVLRLVVGLKSEQNTKLYGV
jgi:preprotein translocase subunit SecD